MNRLLLASLAPLALFASPAAAQDEAGDKVRMVIVYGDDPAPQPEGDEIVVVARLPENERFRIPETLRFSDDSANDAWTNRVERLEMIGDFGTLSCSPVGAGGFTGCTQELIRKAYGASATSSDARFSELIAAARAERLSTIDEEAAAEQERVEQLEREYMERLERERAAELPEEGELILPDPEGTTADLNPDQPRD